MKFGVSLICIGLIVAFCAATNEVISEYYVKLEKVSPIPGSTVSIKIQYPPPNLPKNKILSFFVQNLDDKMNTNFLSMEGGVGYNHLNATIGSDKGKGLNFKWTIETVSENMTKKERINSLLQDLINKEDDRNITSQ